MKRVVVSLALLAVACFSLPAAAQEKDKEKEKKPAAAELLAIGLAQAKKEDKRVFLIFGSPTCGWCKYFEKYHVDPEVSPVIGKHVVLVKVDIVDNPGGNDMYLKHGVDRGVPAWSILNVEGKVLSHSGNGRENLGFPYEPDEIVRYFKAFKQACPKLTDAEVELLTKKLKEIGPKK